MIAKNVDVEVKTRRRMMKFRMTEEDIKTVNSMIAFIKDLSHCDFTNCIREYFEEESLIPEIDYSDLVEWLTACRETLSLGVVWDDETDEILPMVEGVVTELPE